VGPGTFLPIRQEEVERHRMEEEYFAIPGRTIRLIAECRLAGGRIVAAGTSTARALEHVVRHNGFSGPTEGWTDLFIYPGFIFRAVDLLITNLHLPRSTLLLLVSAFAERELVATAYREAVDRRYRFYSYGDAMLIL
jgi:S-adenosylmethionine:tRNA ribosyltransferase-isomerase